MNDPCQRTLLDQIILLRMLRSGIIQHLLRITVDTPKLFGIFFIVFIGMIVTQKQETCHRKLHLMNPHFYEILKLPHYPAAFIDMLRHGFVGFIQCLLQKLSIIKPGAFQCLQHQIFLIHPVQIMKKPPVKGVFAVIIINQTKKSRCHGHQYNHQKQLCSHLTCRQKNSFYDHRHHKYKDLHTFIQQITFSIHKRPAFLSECLH